MGYFCGMKTPDSHFYLSKITTGLVSLDSDESQHAIKVCRATTGDSLELCDGQGHFAIGTIVTADPKACQLRIDSVQTTDRPRPRLTLALACLKDDDIEDVIFHCSQLEIAEVAMLRTERSLEPRKSDLERTLRRCQAKSLVSLKQSRKAWETRVHGPFWLTDWLADFSGELIVCDPRGACRAPGRFAHFERSALLVGPEGGFSPDELEMFAKWRDGSHTHWLGLGPTRLRAVTAPLYALGILASAPES